MNRFFIFLLHSVFSAPVIKLSFTHNPIRNRVWLLNTRWHPSSECRWFQKIDEADDNGKEDEWLITAYSIRPKPHQVLPATIPQLPGALKLICKFQPVRAEPGIKYYAEKDGLVTWITPYRDGLISISSSLESQEREEQPPPIILPTEALHGNPILPLTLHSGDRGAAVPGPDTEYVVSVDSDDEGINASGKEKKRKLLFFG